MGIRTLARCLTAATGLLCLTDGFTVAAGELRCTPESVRLSGNFDRVQVVIETVDSDDSLGSQRFVDQTHQATFQVADERIASVSESGRLTALANGSTRLLVRVPKLGEINVEVVASDMVETPQPGFRTDIGPILSKRGCNLGACHASQYGKGGFVLSVFGFDPDKDWTSIVRDRQQRRINPLNPSASLLLLKPTMSVPHGGSRRLQAGSTDHQVVAAWIAAGCPKPAATEPDVTGLQLYPAERVTSVGASHQMRVVAEYSNGTQKDVTAWARFDSLDDGVLSVDDDGHAQLVGPGQAPLMVRFEGQASVAHFVVPNDKPIQLTGWKDQNFIDELARKKFQDLRLEPSPLCDDATFHRRAYLDAIGSIPTLEETQAFLADTSPDKREQLVDRLLGLTGDPKQDIYNDRFAAYWTLKWSDLIRNTSNRGTVEQAMWALHNWIRESFRTNKPFNQFVQELVTAKGSIYRNGPANYFRINRSSDDLAESTAQLFLGVRLQCAKCHHHPFEKYSQQDYYGFAAFFSRVTNKNSQEFGLFGRESVVMVRSTGDVQHPRTRQIVPPTPLEGDPIDHPLDRRIPLAEWLGSETNYYFPRSVVNRYVGYLLGRGLVEPIDDLRATNPPSNVALMDRLAEEFVASGYDVRQLMRMIMTSRLYQLDSQPLPENAHDRRFFAYYKAKRLPAEALLDSIDLVTESPTKFTKLPAGTRAIELPDAEYPNYFLNTFAKPRRASVCECERMPDENLAQALHTLNGDILTAKIADKKGRVARLMAAKLPHAKIVEELYLAALNRYPTAPEIEASDQFLAQASSPQECYEDLLWALINSKQFLFNH